MTGGHDVQCEGEWESGAMAYTPCRCAERALTSDLPEPMIRVPNPLFEAVVERRARQLCARAEPHEVEERCHVHESEARRQLVNQWQSQSHEASRL